MTLFESFGQSVFVEQADLQITAKEDTHKNCSKRSEIQVFNCAVSLTMEMGIQPRKLISAFGSYFLLFINSTFNKVHLCSSIRADPYFLCQKCSCCLFRVLMHLFF